MSLRNGKLKQRDIIANILFSLSHVWPFATPWTVARQASLSFNISRSLLKLMSIESVMPSNHLLLCCPLLLLPSLFRSIRVFPKESPLCTRWPTYWSKRIRITKSKTLVTANAGKDVDQQNLICCWYSGTATLEDTLENWTYGKTFYRTKHILTAVVLSHQVMSNSCNPMDCSTPGFPVLHHPEVWPSSCPLSRWCHPTISSSVILFSYCPQSHPASGSFPMSQLFASGGQSIGTLASVSVLPMNTQGWFPLRLTGLISLLSKGLSRVFSSITDGKHQFFSTQPSLSALTSVCTWLLERP